MQKKIKARKKTKSTEIENSPEKCCWSDVKTVRLLNEQVNGQYLQTTLSHYNWLH
jgi:hypothetical protein